jgi:hypothetical protein
LIYVLHYVHYFFNGGASMIRADDLVDAIKAAIASPALSENLNEHRALVYLLGMYAALRGEKSE